MLHLINQLMIFSEDCFLHHRQLPPLMPLKPLEESWLQIGMSVWCGFALFRVQLSLLQGGSVRHRGRQNQRLFYRAIEVRNRKARILHPTCCTFFRNRVQVQATAAESSQLTAYCCSTSFSLMVPATQALFRTSYSWLQVWVWVVAAANQWSEFFSLACVSLRGSKSQSTEIRNELAGHHSVRFFPAEINNTYTGTLFRVS